MRRFLFAQDIELLLVVLFWGFNVTVVKHCLQDMEPLAFNIVRFCLASATLLALTFWWDGAPSLRRGEVGRFLLMGLLGHALYQICFVLGLARTTASSTALIFGSTPVVVGIMARAAGHERVGWAGASGGLLAFGGVSLIVQGGASPATPAAGPVATGFDGAWFGNLLVMAAVIFWSAYTVLSRDLLHRHSPLRVTALSLSIGTLMMLPASLPSLARQDWTSIRGLTWTGVLYSFIFALVVSYILWYRSVRAVGNLRTALYSNLVPVSGALFGVWLLGERLSTGVGAGALLILSGILLSRWSDARERRAARAEPVPVGEA